MTTTPRSCRTAVVAATLAALSLAGCSGGSESPGSAPPGTAAPSLSEPSAAPTLEVEPVVASGSVTGRLPRKDRARVEEVVARRAVRFLEAAYLSGDYPRSDFRDAYPGFTPGAAAVARRDRTLLTNKAIAKRVEEVTATGLRVEVDLLAVDRRAVGATTRVDLGFRTTGKVERRYRVRGRLVLTKRDGAWKIFGYDLSKGAR